MTIFITGSSGVLGGALVKHLSQSEPSLGFICLLRANDAEHLRFRAKELLNSWGVKNSERFEFVRGTLSQPLFGFNKEDFLRIAKTSHVALHVASSIDLLAPEQELIDENLEGARSLVEMARINDSLKVHHISTVGVKGQSPNPLKESSLASQYTKAPAFYNVYEKAKYKTEIFLEENFPNKNNLWVHRPSMVVGSSVDGSISHFQVFYFLLKLLRGDLTFGFLPSVRQANIDTIPIDFLVRAIKIVIDTAPRSHRYFTYAAGPNLSWSANRLQQELKAQVRELPVVVFQILVNLSRLVFWLPVKTKKRLELFPQFLAYASTPQRFENQESVKFFAEKGLFLPSPNDYLPLCLKFFYSKTTGKGSPL